MALLGRPVGPGAEAYQIVGSVRLVFRMKRILVLRFIRINDVWRIRSEAVVSAMDGRRHHFARCGTGAKASRDSRRQRVTARSRDRVCTVPADQAREARPGQREVLTQAPPTRSIAV